LGRAYLGKGLRLNLGKGRPEQAPGFVRLISIYQKQSQQRCRWINLGSLEVLSTDLRRTVSPGYKWGRASALYLDAIMDIRALRICSAGAAPSCPELRRVGVEGAVSSMRNTSRIPVGTPLWPRAPATGAKAHATTKEVAGPWGFCAQSLSLCTLRLCALCVEFEFEDRAFEGCAWEN